MNLSCWGIKIRHPLWLLRWQGSLHQLILLRDQTLAPRLTFMWCNIWYMCYVLLYTSATSDSDAEQRRGCSEHVIYYYLHYFSRFFTARSFFGLAIIFHGNDCDNYDRPCPHLKGYYYETTCWNIFWWNILWSTILMAFSQWVCLKMGLIHPFISIPIRNLGFWPTKSGGERIHQ